MQQTHKEEVGGKDKDKTQDISAALHHSVEQTLLFLYGKNIFR